MAKILVVDDDRISQQTAVAILEQIGHTTYVSPNGLHAYETLTAGNEFDLILTDFMMPKMNGQQLIQTLRCNPYYKELPIIIMSAIARVNDISDLLELGATFFLPKPLDRKELENYITRCLTMTSRHLAAERAVENEVG